jgi:hypothetical protein
MHKTRISLLCNTPGVPELFLIPRSVGDETSHSELPDQVTRDIDRCATSMPLTLVALQNALQQPDVVLLDMRIGSIGIRAWPSQVSGTIEMSFDIMS